MKLKVRLFGRLADLHTDRAFDWNTQDANASPASVQDELANMNAALGRALAEPQVLVAVNQEIVSRHQTLANGDELAFLPPVTGG